MPINLKFGQESVGTALLCPILYKLDYLNWYWRSFFKRVHSHGWQAGAQPELLAGVLVSSLYILLEGLLELPPSTTAGFKESLPQEKKSGRCQSPQGPETVSLPHTPMVRQPFCLKRREHRSCLLMEKVTKYSWLLIISHNPHQPLLWLLNYLKVGWIKQTTFWWHEGYKVLTESLSFIIISKKLYYKISISGILTKTIVYVWWKCYCSFKIALLFLFYYTFLPFINTA